jgi:hypothetical protein
MHCQVGHGNATDLVSKSRGERLQAALLSSSHDVPGVGQGPLSAREASSEISLWLVVVEGSQLGSDRWGVPERQLACPVAFSDHWRPEAH